MDSLISTVAGIFLKTFVWIMVIFGFFNLLGFSLAYYKMVSLGYVVQQTAIENNYIPSNDKVSIENYMATLETPTLRDIRFTDDSAINEGDRKQYGNIVKVGVEGDFYVSLPLMWNEQFEGNEGVQSLKDSVSNLKSDAEIERELTNRIVTNEGTGGIRIPIKMEYEVPGLKYYADLAG